MRICCAVLGAVVLGVSPIPAETNTSSTTAALKKLSIEDLMTLEVRDVATLTRTAQRLIPAVVNTMDAAAIQQSGARDLNELLDIYSTDGQMILHHSHVDHFGMRGIISDREDKYLLRVNGQVMNQRLYVGVDTERGLPLLGDLRKVSVVYGPGSATYGAGALAGVVNLETYNGLTFQGMDAYFRQGFLDQMTAGEVRYGHQFSKDSGLFLYYGVADRRGADSDYVFGRSFATPNPNTPNVVAGQPVPFPVRRLNEAAYGGLQHKAHVSYVHGPVELWARYTQGGANLRPERSLLSLTTNMVDDTLGFVSFNRQFTAVAAYQQDLSATFNLHLQLAYDYNQNIYDRSAAGVTNLTGGASVFSLVPLDREEHAVRGRAIGNWKPVDAHALALGLEHSHEIYRGRTGNDSRYPVDHWSADTISVMAEHQWTLNNRWTTFLSGRVDKHTYSDWLFSPRAALVFTPTDKESWKLIAARAMRRSGDAELRRLYTTTSKNGQEESMYSLELRYDRQHNDNWRFGIGAYVEDYYAIGIAQQVGQAAYSTSVGQFLIFGLEPEISWVNKQTRATLSHSYTQLLDARKITPGQGISAMPFGYGDSLANWADHVTKLTLVHDLTRQWSASTSLRVYWGLPGAKDMARWNNTLANPYNLSLTDPGYDQAFGPSVHWNAGVEFRPNKHLTLRADLFNIAGWMDETLSKRNYILRGSEYSVEPPAVMLSARVAY
jgi:iron complex outermembrane receptor protein